MPDYLIDIAPLAASGPVSVAGSPVEIDPEALYALADSIVADISPGWEASVEGIRRMDLGTAVERPVE